MFETLTEKLAQTFKKLRGHGRLDDKVVEEALREVKLSLLEADVNFKVVKEFVARVGERARGQEVMGSLTPAQQVVKIVRDELLEVMGGEAVPLARAKHPPATVMFAGLQGSGKTTTVGKLALHLAGQGQKCLLAAGDIHRPAAADQLADLGARLGVEVVRPGEGEGLDDLCRRATAAAVQSRADYILFDTAGRLHVDREMMDEAAALARLAKPVETLLVVDAMTGQEAVNVALGFAAELTLTGVVLTKFEGDARGGAALSIRKVVGVPVKFVGLGEKLEALEVFHPDRLVSRILGMGDVLTLVEKAQKAMDAEQAKVMGARLRKNQFTLDDFRDNLKTVRRMGSMEEVLSMVPGLSKAVGKSNLKVEEKELRKIEAIISSMTPGERQNHKIISVSRRRRIAGGSGTDIQDVHRLIKRFEDMQKMMKRFNKVTKLTGSMKLSRGMFPT